MIMKAALDLGPTMPAAIAERVTERDMLDALRRRYSVDPGNGPRYVYAEQVRNAAGFNASRTCDFMALDVWPSSGLALHGFEVKVRRSDWLRELTHPEKAAAFQQHCDFWWLVCPPGVAAVSELPPGWGMLRALPDGPANDLFSEPHDWKLRVAAQAPMLHPRRSVIDDQVDRSFMTALLRASVRTARVEAGWTR